MALGQRLGPLKGLETGVSPEQRQGGLLEPGAVSKKHS